MRILWVAPYSFEPPTSGGRVRQLNELKLALADGHEVDLWVVGGDEVPPMSSLEGLRIRRFDARDRSTLAQKAKSVLARLPHWAWLCATPEVESAFRTEVGQYDLVHLDELHTAFLAPLADGVPIIVTLHNIESTANKALARESKPLRRARLLQEASKLSKLERIVFRSAKTVVAVSEGDARFARDRQSRHVVVAPNGVDTSYYADVWHGPPAHPTATMTANFGYEPNDHATRWFVDDVLPLLWSADPRLRIQFVGAEPPEWLIQLGSDDDRVLVTGPVSDVRPYLQASSCAFVPLLSGGGTSLKMAEALAVGLPIVSTSVGARGYEVTDLAVVADDASSFAEGIIHALDGDEFQVDRIGYARRSLDWKTTLRPLLESLRSPGDN